MCTINQKHTWLQLKLTLERIGVFCLLFWVLVHSMHTMQNQNKICNLQALKMSCVINNIYKKQWKFKCMKKSSTNILSFVKGITFCRLSMKKYSLKKSLSNWFIKIIYIYISGPSNLLISKRFYRSI